MSDEDRTARDRGVAPEQPGVGLSERSLRLGMKTGAGAYAVIAFAMAVLLVAIVIAIAST